MRSSIESYSRRAFLRDALLAPVFAGIAGACGRPEQPLYETEINVAFGKSMRDLLRIANDTTINEFAAMAADRMYGPTDPAWMIDQPLGDIQNSGGELKHLSLSPDGEALVDGEERDPVILYMPDPILRQPFLSPEGAQVIVYGNNTTIKHIQEQSAVLGQMADTLFKGSLVPDKVFVVNFSPARTQLPFDELPDFSDEEKAMIIQNFGVATSHRTNEGVISQVGVILNANYIDWWAHTIGIPVEYSVIESAANERVGVLATETANMLGYPRSPFREAITTIAGWASIFDRSVTGNLLIGKDAVETYGKAIGDEMAELRETALKAL